MPRAPGAAAVLAALLLACACSVAAGDRSFVVAKDAFVLDGEVLQIRSGSVHYSRVPRAYWRDRLERLRAMGLNSVATYVPWNWHEEREGALDFSGARDLAAFLREAQGLGLLVLLRAGPYVCGEWEFGGLPAWVLRHNVTIRTYEPNYIGLVERWWGQLLDRVRPLLYSNGGPVVMMQVENEFGSYGNVAQVPADRRYMEHLVALAHGRLGEGSVVLYTTDGGSLDYMARGSLNGSSVLTLGDGGWACAAQAQLNPPGLNACMNSEDYTGWLTHWGEAMANTSSSDCGVAKALEDGHSFNLYMGHGGTNFGWTSGANGGGKSFQPDITSYDYGAPVSENGDHGFGSDGKDKFVAIRQALLPYAPDGGFPAEPAPLPRRAYGAVALGARALLLSAESLRILAPAGPKAFPVPVAMEELGQNNGFVLYASQLRRGGSVLEIAEYPRDRAQAFVDGSYSGAVYRPEAAPLRLASPARPGSTLSLLVENMGRLNFGGGMTDPKGINTAVTLDGEEVAGPWETWCLPLDYAHVSALRFQEVRDCGSAAGPAFYRGLLSVAGAPADTYLRPQNFTKGVMWVNGHNIGRYWETQGPQHAFYVPAPFLKSGSNDVIILELDRASPDCTVTFADRPDFSGRPGQRQGVSSAAQARTGLSAGVRAHAGAGAGAAVWV